MEKGQYLIESIVTIFSTMLDMYLTCEMISFLDGRIWRKTVRKSLLCIIWMMVTAICLVLFIDKKFYGIVYFGSLIIWVIFESRKQLVRRLLYMLGSALMIGMTNLSITCGLSFVFYDELYFYDIPFLEIFAGIICFVMYSVLLAVGKKYLSSIEEKLSDSLLIFSILMLGANSFILMYALDFAQCVQDIQEKREISIVFAMVSLGMLVELVLVIFSVAGVHAYRTMLKYKDALIEAQNIHTEYIKKSNYNLRKIKHDCKAHYGVIDYLLKKESYKEAHDYVKELTDSLEVAGSCCDTGSLIVDALVSEKMAFAQANDIAFSFRGSLPQGCKMRETEQCILFSNILNNAFEAVMKLEKQKRKIEITIRSYESELMILAANTYAGELMYQDGELITSKTEKEEHGFGIHNIREIIGKYGGKVNVGIEEGLFVVRVSV